MTKQEKRKLKQVIEYIEQLQNECRQDSAEAVSNNGYYYFYGAFVNVRCCLEEIKKQFKID